MEDIIFFDPHTGKVLNDEIRALFNNKPPKTEAYSHVQMVSREYVEIKDGFIVKRYTKAELEEKKRLEEQLNDELLFAKINSHARREEFSQPQQNIETTRPAPSRSNSYTPQRHQVSRNRQKTKTTTVNLQTIINNIRREILKRKSVTDQKQSSKRNRAIKKRINQAKAITAIILLTAAIGAAGYGIGEWVDNMEYMISHNQYDKAAAILLDSTPESYNPDIVEQNTTHDYVRQVYWYDDNAIARDVLALPDETFDANLYLVYANMGDNAANAYDNHFDNVISYIGRFASPEENPIAYQKCHGCSNLSDFLVKNGFVDKNGLPNIDLYIKYGRTATITHKTFMQKEADEYLAEYLASVDGKVKGGR